MPLGGKMKSVGGVAGRSGLFVTFEGGEGAGKSTHIRRLADSLRRAGHDVLVTREPGGSPGAEAVRHVLLSGAAEEFGVRMEAILFAAARSDHVEEVIRPALESGAVRSEEHTSELQSLMRISYAVFCLNKKKQL